MGNQAKLEIRVMGPVEVRRDGVVVDHPDLRRQRVRDLLCYVIAHGRVRREQAAEDLWPHLHDSARNLRVTLSYLQRILDPHRLPGQRPTFVRSDSMWLELTAGDHLSVDVWELDTALADPRNQSLDTTLAQLALWRGEPYAEVPYALWIQRARERLRSRYTTAAVRTAECCLGAGRFDDAQTAAQHAIDADPWCEAAYQLLARSHLAIGDTVGARRAMAACRDALRDLDVEVPSAT